MKKRIVLLVAVFLSCAAPTLAGDGEPKGGKVDPAGTTVKSGKSNADNRVTGGNVDAATTVKGSKSNSSERAGGAGVEAGTTVKSGKSNTSD